MAEGTGAPPQTFSISPRDLFTPLPEGFILAGFLLFLILLHSLSRTRFELDPITVNRLLLGSVIFLTILSLTELRGYLLAKSGRIETALEAMAQTVKAWAPFLMVGIGHQLNQSAVIGFMPGTIERNLMELDRAFFLGNDPVLLIEGATFPLLTDWFAFAYSLNFFIPASVALILHFSDRRSDYRV